MPSLADYFEKNRYNSKYEFGSRVFGWWNKIPFVGTIYGDSVVNEEQGPIVRINLDLPLKHNNKYHYWLVVPHKEVKLKAYK